MVYTNFEVIVASPKTSKNTTPRSNQVERQIREQIESGKYLPGDRLPQEREWALELGISRGTLRSVLSKLTQQRLVERHQGRGTYVAKAAVTSGYICVVVVGPDAKTTLHNTVAIAEIERLADSHGLHVTVRFCEDAAALQHTINESEREQTITAGLILGIVPPCPLNDWVGAAHKPWVLMADILSERRSLPLMQQIIFDWYAAFELGTRHLLQAGSRRPALFVLTASYVWSRDRISAFRAQCDEAGIDPRDQKVYDLHRHHHRPGTVAEYQAAVQLAVDETINEWSEFNAPPDGIILPATQAHAWESRLMTKPKLAKQLQGVPFVFWCIEEDRPHLNLPGPVSYLHLSVAELVKQAMNRLLENHNSDMPIRRDYVRAHRIVQL